MTFKNWPYLPSELGWYITPYNHIVHLNKVAIGPFNNKADYVQTLKATFYTGYQRAFLHPLKSHNFLSKQLRINITKMWPTFPYVSSQGSYHFKHFRHFEGIKDFFQVPILFFYLTSNHVVPMLNYASLLNEYNAHSTGLLWRPNELGKCRNTV